MKSKLENLINAVIAEYCAQETISKPDGFSYDLSSSQRYPAWDLACNVAFKLAKITRQKPADIAGKLMAQLDAKVAKDSPIEKTELAGGGFINFI
jgi:arginyl-tRNA synthetase